MATGFACTLQVQKRAKTLLRQETPYACVQIQKICYTSCGRVHLKCKRLSIKQENFHMRLMMVVQAHQG
eukprot:Em0015g123a